MVEKDKKRKPRKPSAPQIQVTVNLTAPTKPKRKRKKKAKVASGFDPRAVGISGPVGTINSGLTPVIFSPTPPRQDLFLDDDFKKYIKNLYTQPPQQNPLLQPPQQPVASLPQQPANPSQPQQPANPLQPPQPSFPRPALERSNTTGTIEGSVRDFDRDAVKSDPSKPEPLSGPLSGQYSKAAEDFSNEVDRQRALQEQTSKDAVLKSVPPPSLTAQDRGSSVMSDITMADEGGVVTDAKTASAASAEAKEAAKKAKAEAKAAAADSKAAEKAAQKAATAAQKAADKKQKEDERAAKLAAKIRGGGGGGPILRDF